MKAVAPVDELDQQERAPVRPPVERPRRSPPDRSRSGVISPVARSQSPGWRSPVALVADRPGAGRPAPATRRRRGERPDLRRRRSPTVAPVRASTTRRAWWIEVAVLAVLEREQRAVGRQAGTVGVRTAVDVAARDAHRSPRADGCGAPGRRSADVDAETIGVRDRHRDRGRGGSRCPRSSRAAARRRTAAARRPPRVRPRTHPIRRRSGRRTRRRRCRRRSRTPRSTPTGSALSRRRSPLVTVPGVDLVACRSRSTRPTRRSGVAGDQFGMPIDGGSEASLPGRDAMSRSCPAA